MKWLIPITAFLYWATGYSQSNFSIVCVDNPCGEIRESTDCVTDGGKIMPIAIRGLNRDR